MLAISCKFGNEQFFFNKKKSRPQKHITHAYMHNIDKNDINVIADTSALICCLLTNGYRLENLTEILLYDAKNKNITKTVKTDELENYKKYFHIYNDFNVAYTSGEEIFPHDIIEENWGGLSNLSDYLKLKLFLNCDYIVIADSNYFDEIKKSVSQFNKEYAEFTYSTENYTIVPMNDKLFIKLKLALSAEIYDSFGKIELV